MSSQNRPALSVSIPRDQLARGIELCIARAREVLEAAQLLEPDFVQLATVLQTLAIQELGKAKLMREAFNGGSDPVTIHGWQSHSEKVKMARKLLPPAAFVSKEGGFQWDGFQDTGFPVHVAIDEPTRVRSLYVDFDSAAQRWKEQPPVDPNTVREAIRVALAALPEAEEQLLIPEG